MKIVITLDSADVNLHWLNTSIHEKRFIDLAAFDDMNIGVIAPEDIKFYTDDKWQGGCDNAGEDNRDFPS